MGKGSAPRIPSVSKDQYDKRYEATFGKKCKECKKDEEKVNEGAERKEDSKKRSP